MTLKTTLFLFTGLAFFAGCAKKTPESPFRISLVRGEAALSNRQGESRPLKVGDPVGGGDIFTAGPASGLEIADGADSLVVDEGTKGNLTNGRLTLVHGKAFVMIEKDSGGIEINTHEAVAAAQRGYISIESEGKSTILRVLSGELSVRLRGGDGTEASVRAGQNIILYKDAGHRLYVYRMARADIIELRRWVGAPRIDRVLQGEVFNEPPQIFSEPALRVLSGGLFEYQVEAHDPDGDSLQFILAKCPKGMSITPKGKLRWRPAGSGIFPVGLSVRDGSGASAEQSFSLKVGGTVIADFKVNPPLARRGEEITFDARSSRGPGALSYRWDLNADGRPDGDFSPSNKASTTFSASGSYKITLQVKASGNLADTAVRTVVINEPPVAALAVTPASGDTSTTFSIRASNSTDPENDPLTFRFDSDGDGKFDAPAEGSSATPEVRRKFSRPGKYTVHVEAKDAYGRTSAAQAAFEVTVGFLIKLSGPALAVAGVPVEFEVASPSRDAFERLDWNLGEESGEDTTTAIPHLRRSFKKPGKYRVRVRAQNREKSWAQDSVSLEVVLHTLDARAGNDTTLPVYSKAFFHGEGEDATLKIARYEWDFEGDGRIDATSERQGEAEFLYKRAGEYHARFKVISENGAFAEDSVKVTVWNVPPVVEAGPDLLSEEGDKVVLTCRAYDPAGRVEKIEWDFEADGKFDTLVDLATFKKIRRGIPGKQPGLLDTLDQYEGKLKHRFDVFSRAVVRVTDSDGATAFDTVKVAICPKGMAGVQGEFKKKPFTYCMDLYEWPNQKGSAPEAQVSFEEAREKCKSTGKRLCSPEEWTLACKGSEGFLFPYANTFDSRRCNTDGNGKQLVPSGQFETCVSSDGVFDLSGNAAEWTESGGEKEALMGGFYLSPMDHADCSAKLTKGKKEKFFFSGFRCCK